MPKYEPSRLKDYTDEEILSENVFGKAILGFRCGSGFDSALECKLPSATRLI